MEGVACVELRENEPERTFVVLDCFYNTARVEEASLSSYTSSLRPHTLVA